MNMIELPGLPFGSNAETERVPISELGGPKGGLGSSDCAHVSSKFNLPKCCDFCHGRNELQNVRLDNSLLRLCCTLVTELMSRWPNHIEYVDQ